jgi:hypothetical protein
MPYYVITYDESGSMQMDSVEPVEQPATPQQELQKFLEEKDRARSTGPMDVLVASQKALDVPQPESNPFKPLDQPAPRLGCPHCEFSAATEQGLTSHIRNRHKE